MPSAPRRLSYQVRASDYEGQGGFGEGPDAGQFGGRVGVQYAW
jgi:hypothetical protein